MPLNVRITKTDMEYGECRVCYYYNNFFVGYIYHGHDQLPAASIVIGAKYYNRMGKHVPIIEELGEFKTKGDAHTAMMRAIINDDVVQCIIDNSPNSKQSLIKETI